MIRPYVFGIASMVLLTFGAFYFDDGDTTWFKKLCAEDGFIEYATALAFATASVCFLLTALRGAYLKIFCWGYAALFMLVAGEEVSWGQRLLGFSTPDAMVQINVQGEFNMHNLDGIHGIARAMGLVVVLLICYGFPLIDRFSRALRKLHARYKVPICPLWLAPLTIMAFVCMAAPRGAYVMGWAERRQSFAMDEIGEFYLGLNFLIFALLISGGRIRTCYLWVMRQQALESPNP